MSMSDIPKSAEKLFREVQANDDLIGHYSDHEGTEGGPTFYLWALGYEKFKSHCIRAIKDHRTAIATFKKLQKVNETRK